MAGVCVMSAKVFLVVLGGALSCLYDRAQACFQQSSVVRHARRSWVARWSNVLGSAQGFADVDPWLDGTLRFGGGYSTWSPPSSPVMAEVCHLIALLYVQRERA